MKKCNNRGFSLVELLISIAIIGLLSTIVLNNVSDSRARAYDSKVRQQLANFRTAAEMYFTNQEPNSYGPAVASCTSGIFNNFESEKGTPGIYIAEGNLPLNTQTACRADNDSYAIKASLYSGTQYWCVDNKGSNRLIDGTVDGPSLFCP